MIAILGNFEGRVETGYDGIVYCRTWSIDKKLRCRQAINNGKVPNVYGLLVDLSGDGEIVMGIHMPEYNPDTLKNALLKIADGYPGVPNKGFSGHYKSELAFNALSSCKVFSVMGGVILEKDDACIVPGDIHICSSCGLVLEEVRPGKFQCNHCES